MTLVDNGGCCLIGCALRDGSCLGRFHGNGLDCRFCGVFFCLALGLLHAGKISDRFLFLHISAVFHHIVLVVTQPAVQLFVPYQETGVGIVIIIQFSVICLHHVVEFHSVVNIQRCHGTVKLPHRKAHMINGQHHISGIVVIALVPGDGIDFFQHRRHFAIRYLIPGNPAILGSILINPVFLLIEGRLDTCLIGSQKRFELLILRGGDTQVIISQTVHGEGAASANKSKAGSDHIYFIIIRIARSEGNGHFIAVGEILTGICHRDKLFSPGILYAVDRGFCLCGRIEILSCCSIGSALLFFKKLGQVIKEFFLVQFSPGIGAAIDALAGKLHIICKREGLHRNQSIHRRGDILIDKMNAVFLDVIRSAAVVGHFVAVLLVIFSLVDPGHVVDHRRKGV